MPRIDFILDGFKAALDKLDETIKLIRNSKDPSIARESLIKKLKISVIQA